MLLERRVARTVAWKVARHSPAIGFQVEIAPELQAARSEPKAQDPLHGDRARQCPVHDRNAAAPAKLRAWLNQCVLKGSEEAAENSQLLDHNLTARPGS